MFNVPDLLELEHVTILRHTQDFNSDQLIAQGPPFNVRGPSTSEGHGIDVEAQISINPVVIWNPAGVECEAP